MHINYAGGPVFISSPPLLVHSVRQFTDIHFVLIFLKFGSVKTFDIPCNILSQSPAYFRKQNKIIHVICIINSPITFKPAPMLTG